MLNRLKQITINLKTVTNLTKLLQKRRHVRIVAVQTLFQMINPPAYLTTEVALEYALNKGNDPEEGYDHVTNDYLYHLVEGVIEKQSQIDEKIQTYLENWTMDRLQRIDLVILRIAVYEMLFVDDSEVPNTVAVDEAIELAKGFSGEKSRQFVSGILMKMLNESNDSPSNH